MDAAARVLRSRLGGYATSARYDSHEINAKARATYRDSFRLGHECRLCPAVVLPQGLSPEEIERRATALRKSHFTRLAQASKRRRAMKKPVPVIETTGDGHGGGTQDANPSAA